MRDVANRLGISLPSMLADGGTTAEIERVFADMAGQQPDSPLVTGESDLYANRQLIATLAQKHRLPIMCPYRDYVDAGDSTDKLETKNACHKIDGLIQILCTKSHIAKLIDSDHAELSCFATVASLVTSGSASIICWQAWSDR